MATNSYNRNPPQSPDLPGETWQDVPTWENVYQVSDQGRVRRCFNGRAPRLRRGWLDPSTGDPRMWLSVPGRDQGIRKADLVLLAFVGAAPTGHILYHRNGDRTDLRLDNLAWAPSPTGSSWRRHRHHRSPCHLSTQTILQRIFARVQITTGCWLWTGPVDRYGYAGHLSIDGKQYYCLHRLVWQEVVGSIPVGYDVHHRCEVPNCVNLDHLCLMEHNKHGAYHGKGEGS